MADLADLGCGYMYFEVAAMADRGLTILAVSVALGLWLPLLGIAEANRHLDDLGCPRGCGFGCRCWGLIEACASLTILAVAGVGIHVAVHPEAVAVADANP